MKKFEITPKGSLTQYIQENAIKTKDEINNAMFLGPEKSLNSCFGITLTETSKGLSVAL